MRLRSTPLLRPGPAGRTLLVAVGVFIPMSHVRAQTSAPTPTDSVERAAHERVVLITGSTDGLGRQVALTLAGPGTHVIVHGRNRQRGEDVVRSIQAAGGSARFYRFDLAALDQVRELGEAILLDYDRLDVLVNNAGIWLQGDDRRLSADGHELHFAVNYLSHYLLTRMLLPRIVASSPARVINVASGAQRRIDFENVMLERGYDSGRGYAQSKLAQVMFTFDLARELEGTGVAVNTLHPATMMNTTMVLSRGANARSTVEEGAAAVVNLIESDDIGTGQYFDGHRRARAHEQAYDPQACAQLHRLSRDMAGL